QPARRADRRLRARRRRTRNASRTPIRGLNWTGSMRMVAAAPALSPQMPVWKLVLLLWRQSVAQCRDHLAQCRAVAQVEVALRAVGQLHPVLLEQVPRALEDVRADVG